MATEQLPELWQWAEFYCPWCYITAVRLDKVAPEYQGRVRLRERAFPLEVFGGGPPDRHELGLEIWLAALQEPAASFAPLTADWPATTLPAFDGAWCAAQQGEAEGHAFDLRLRRAFFAEGRNIGRPDVVAELARELGLDMGDFARRLAGGEARAAVLAEGRLGKEQYRVRGTPTLMLASGEKLRHPVAYPDIKDGVIESVGTIPCCGEGCYAATREFFQRAAATGEPG